jgi:CYTH domain-containing protein
MAIVYNVQVHPIYAGHINDHKVLIEREFDTKQEAIEYRDWFNREVTNRIAVYQGAIDTETGENL